VTTWRPGPSIFSSASPKIFKDRHKEPYDNLCYIHLAKTALVSRNILRIFLHVVLRRPFAPISRFARGQLIHLPPLYAAAIGGLRGNMRVSSISLGAYNMHMLCMLY